MACVKQSFQEYVEGTLIAGIRVMQCAGFEYLSFALIGTSIELLGFFFDPHGLDDERQARKRFNKAVEELFRPLGKGYGPCPKCTSKNHDDYCLFRGLRCGMAHIGRPQGKIAFTTRREALAEKTAHLRKAPDGKLILVAEELADDFVAAWEALKSKLSSGITHKKVTDDFLAINNYAS
jgi:hypothetical protein